MRIAALDQGTTSTRLLVFGDGKVDTIGSKRHRTTYPQPGWVEQDANELLGNIAELLGRAGPIEAIGLANQGESCLAWDSESGEPLSPVIVWQDTRTVADLEALSGDGAESLIKARAALPIDPYFSAAKLSWIVRNMPRAHSAWMSGRLRLGTTDAFFLDRLTGSFVTDRATASRTSLLNIETGEWDPDLCKLFGVPIECLPRICANTAGFGVIAGVPVTAAAVDQQAALFGHGCRAAGDAKITFGTGAFALAVTGRDVPRDGLESGLVPTVAWDLGDGITYALDGGVPDAGSAVEWAVRAGFAADVADFNIPPRATAIDRGLVFIPAFSGLGCPYWDRTAAPLLIGLRPEMERLDVCQALLEGIALQTAIVIEAMGKHIKMANRLAIDGGLSQNPYFAQFLADCTGAEILVDGFSERTAFGVAQLAALAHGKELEPIPAKVGLYKPRPSDGLWKSRFESALARMRGWS